MKNPDLTRALLNKWPVKIVCIVLAWLLYSLYINNTLTERQLTIPLSVYTPEGFVVSSDYPDHISVIIRGEENDVSGILPDDIEAYASLARYSDRGEYKIPIEFRKKGSALLPDALEMRSRPRDIILSLEDQTVRSLEIKPEISGFPALGYELTQYFVSPSSVTVIGPSSQMSSLGELKTELIDMSGRNSDFTVSTRIVRPSRQISIPGGEVVEFRGVIDEAVVIRTIADREVVVFDLPEGLKIAGNLPTVSLTVRGSQLTVEAARPQDMTFYLDGSRIKTPGTYTQSLRMDIPQGLAVLQLMPLEITFDVVQETENQS